MEEDNVKRLLESLVFAVMAGIWINVQPVDG